MHTYLAFKEENEWNEKTTSIKIVIEQQQRFVIVYFWQCGGCKDGVQGYKHTWHHTTGCSNQGEVDFAIDTHIETKDHNQQCRTGQKTRSLAKESEGENNIENNRQRTSHVVYI